ncbi:MAG: TAXI family TRAP transporter solute-binding subunit [Fuerstiella sp.]|nr:TAXI family TRAP transporter solute-binding subunit [Fuerstiella sp.]MCP4858512.1 TAXI family TRAP transporter solute-binding subunit [Fuerstiella sp.]
MSIVEPIRLLDEFRQRRRELLRMIGPGVIVTIAAFAVAFYFVEPPPPQTVVIATGGTGGRYHAFAEKYATAFARHGVTLELRETAGSVENFDLLLHDDTVSLAIVQGGTAPPDARTAGSIEAIASLYFEPLWVFHRADLPIETLGDLKGRRIALGATSSGSSLLATQLLAMNGIHDGRDGTEFLNQNGLQAASSLDDDQIDVAMFVVGPESPVLRQLLGNSKLVLMDFARQQAYARRLPFLKAVVLEEGVVDFENNLPRKRVRLIAPAANLVTTSAMHDAFVPLLLEVALEQHRDGGLLADDGELPSQDYVSFPVNSAARSFLAHGPSFFQRHLSFWVASMIDRTKILIIPLLTLLIPLFKIAPPVYRWRIRSRIYRWYDVLRGIDQKLREEQNADPEEHAARLQAMSNELNTVHVPLSYMEEFYNLRLHIDLVNAELEKQTRLRDSTKSSDATTPDCE